MIWRVLRGGFSVAAAATGLLLVYGLIYAMEGMTTRLPTASARELVFTSLFMLPWSLLYCSGLAGFANIGQQPWIFWLGLVPALAFLYFYEGHTGSSLLTKVVMPPLVALVGTLPHVVTRLRFVFTIFRLIAGITGLVVIYHVAEVLVSSSFATREIEILIAAFGLTCTVTGILSVKSFRRRPIQMI